MDPLSHPEPGRIYTYEDYLELPDDGKRYQIVDGKLYVSPAPRPRHQEILSNLHFMFRLWIEEGGSGIVYFAPFDVIFGERDVVQPDLVWFSNEDRKRIGNRGSEGAPTLAAEVLSDSTRRLDIIKKRRQFEEFGVEEYWILDPAIDVVQVLRRDGDALTKVTELEAGDGVALTSPLLPGLALDLGKLFPPPED